MDLITLYAHLDKFIEAFSNARVLIDDADTGWLLVVKTIHYAPEYNAVVIGGDYQGHIEK